jgi:hypothetical protein
MAMATVLKRSLLKQEKNMPIEYIILKDWPVPLRECPRCGIQPFTPFLRGMVRNHWRAFWRRPEWCLICSQCKEIVGYERAVVHQPLGESLHEFLHTLRQRFTRAPARPRQL